MVPRSRSSGARPAWRPLKAPRGPARTRRRVLPPALGGSQLPGQPHSETKMAVRGTLWRPPLAIVHLSHQAWGAAHGSFITRPRTFYGARTARPERASEGDLSPRAPSGRRMPAGGALRARPRRPDPGLAAGTWSGRGRQCGRATESEDGARRRKGPGRCRLSGSL